MSMPNLDIDLQIFLPFDAQGKNGRTAPRRKAIEAQSCHISARFCPKRPAFLGHGDDRVGKRGPGCRLRLSATTLASRRLPMFFRCQGEERGCKLSNRRTRIGCAASALLLLALSLTALAVAWFQGRQTPAGRPQYVALGSSFAAGAGLGSLQPGSPLLCARSVNGYPPQLARMRGLSIVDMSCGGAITKHVLDGGQFFQGPQIRTINGQTRLVTLTVGGNDIGYVGDLSMLAARNSTTSFGWLVNRFWVGPRTQAERRFGELQRELVATLQAIHHLAPEATVVVATYPAILPPTGTCALLGLSQAEAEAMRKVGDQLARVTQSAARQTGALLVDMNALGSPHNACSPVPWTKGWTNGGVAPFHPTLQGAKATAEAIQDVLVRANK